MRGGSNPGKDQSGTQQDKPEVGFRGSLLSSQWLVCCPSTQPTY